MASVMETHLIWVEKLKERGETVLQPKYGKPMGSTDGYIKTQIPHKDAGCIFEDKHGTFGLFGDMGALPVTGIKWEDLGLCDARCYYEWMNPESYRPEPEANDILEIEFNDRPHGIVEDDAHENLLIIYENKRGETRVVSIPLEVIESWGRP